MMLANLKRYYSDLTKKDDLYTLSCKIFLTIIFLLIAISFDSVLASTNTADFTVKAGESSQLLGVMCWVIQFLTGPTARVVMVIVVIGTAGGAMFGKFDPKTGVIVIVCCGGMMGAPVIVVYFVRATGGGTIAVICSDPNAL